MSEPCPPGYTRINGNCVKSPTPPPPPTLVAEEDQEENVKEDKSEDEG